jgi:hypothetical protein
MCELFAGRRASGFRLVPVTLALPAGMRRGTPAAFGPGSQAVVAPVTAAGEGRRAGAGAHRHGGPDEPSRAARRGRFLGRRVSHHGPRQPQGQGRRKARMHTVFELRRTSCISLEEVAPQHKGMAGARSFGPPVRSSGGRAARSGHDLRGATGESCGRTAWSPAGSPAP